MTPTERARLIDEEERKAASAELMERALAYSLEKRTSKDERVTASIKRGYESSLLKRKCVSAVDDTVKHTIEGRSLTMAGWAKRLKLNSRELRQGIMHAGSLTEFVKDHYQRKAASKVYKAIAPKALMASKVVKPTAIKAPKQITQAATYEAHGKCMTLTQWSTHLGLSRQMLYKRLRRGLSNDEVFNVQTPTRSKYVARKPKLLSANGKAQTLEQWATEIGIAARTLRSRLSIMPLEKALLPVRKGNKQYKTHKIDGESLTIKQWAERYGINVTTVHHRLRLGIPLHEALTLPKHHKAITNRDQTPGLCDDFLTFGRTGGGSAAQEISEISFSARTNVQ